MALKVVRDGKQVFRLSQAKINLRRRQLNALNNTVCRSWRKVSDEYYPEISFQLLHAFASGKRIPSSVRACKALDLLYEKNRYSKLPRWYKRIPAALKYFNTKGEQIKKMSDETRKRK